MKQLPVAAGRRHVLPAGYVSTSRQIDRIAPIFERAKVQADHARGVGEERGFFAVFRRLDRRVFLAANGR